MGKERLCHNPNSPLYEYSNNCLSMGGGGGFGKSDENRRNNDYSTHN